VTKPAELARFLKRDISDAGLRLDEIADSVSYQDRPAWAIYYRDPDCKLQICWSARNGGIDFLLAPLDAPNEFGLLNGSKKWRFMLMLSDAHDDLPTPVPGADADTEMSWLKALFEVHFQPARAALLSGQ
jgi:hypothetical protein